MENTFHQRHKQSAKEARQQRVTRSLRNMEDEANELVAFLDDQRDRRRTINIMYGTGKIPRLFSCCLPVTHWAHSVYINHAALLG